MDLTDADLAAGVLGGAGYDVVDYATRYLALQDRLNLDFGGILFALDAIPLCLRGAAHVTSRRLVARMIAERQGALVAGLPAQVARRFACLCVPGAHDLLAEAVIPVVDDLIADLIGLRPDVPADALISRVFSQAIGIAKRRRMDAELADLTARIAAAFPEEDSRRHGARLSLAILGRDALIGTLAGSLRDVILAADGRPLNTVAMPGVPTRTGVPYIDRIARVPAVVAGCPVQAGQAVRVRLDAFEGRGPEDRQRFFGAGAHVCLGRPLSLALVQALADFVTGVDTRVTLTGWQMRKDDVFALPDIFCVKVD